MWQIAPYDLFPQSKPKDSKTASAAAGIAYHQRVYKVLEKDMLAYDDLELYVEPWLWEAHLDIWCQPDAVIVNPHLESVAVIEVKMNWKIGRDHKVLGQYKEASAQAFEARFAYPSMIVSNIWRLPHQPFVNRQQFYGAIFQPWKGSFTLPLLLLP